jgi:glyoxylase-like metal-dependent hydrolase (beta-lactamase superfamily II)
MPLGDFLTGEEGKIRAPVLSYLIEHPKGRLVFDSGMHKSMQDNPKARIGEWADYFGVEFLPGQDLAARLGQIDVDVKDIDYLVNSHLHFDHAGGNDAVCDCPVVLQKPEWDAAMDPDLAQANGFSKQDYDLGQDMKLVEGEHDLFGDGSVVCIPTYGHTPGHQSLKLKLPSGDVLLTGDACYLRRSLEELRLPSVAHDKDQALASFRKIGELEARGARLIFGHDPDQWDPAAAVPQQIA